MTCEQHLTAWLTLASAPGLGPVQIRALLEAGLSAQDLIASPPATLRDLGLPEPVRRWLRQPDRARIESDLAWVQGAAERHILTLNDPEYPLLLREIADPPTLLYVRGDVAALSRPQLAVVGSRNPTPGGAEVARAFAAELAGIGLTVTSGLALGIDANAHAGALQAGGSSIAVLGTGPDRCYPAQHRDLAESLTAGGALVTEFCPGTGPRPEHFPRRNRIISGLSLGCLVVEAALKSGSLITARLAAEQGREVFAIPGSIHSPLARGAHALLRDGAKLVEDVADILLELGSQFTPRSTGQTRPASRQDPPGLTEIDRKLLDAMGFDPVNVDLVVERSGLTADRVSSILLNLELRGYAASSPGGLYYRVQKWGNDERERP